MFSKLRSRHTPFLLLGVFGLGSAFSLVGCGGDSGNSAVSSTSRHFTSTVNLTSPQTAALDLVIASNNTATGTMTVNDPTRAAHSRAVVVTVQLTGTVAANGDLSLTGTYTQGETTQTTRVTGNIGTATGTYVLNYLSQNFNGTWTAVAAANPSGSGASVTFSNVSGVNATTTSRNLALVAGVDLTIPGVGKQLTISASASGTGDTSGTLSLAVQGGATVGNYTIDDDKYQVIYSEGPLTAARQWAANGGTIQIVSVSASKVSFKVIGATMRAQSSLANPAAAGTFTVDVTGETTALVSQ